MKDILPDIQCINPDAWHLGEVLADVTKGKPVHRVTYNEITKNAVCSAVANPGTLNMARVDAQRARRILDRLVGREGAEGNRVRRQARAPGRRQAGREGPGTGGDLFSPHRTMVIAQKLYETGLVADMRTDSVNIAAVARGIAYNAVANERAFDALEPGQVALDAASDAFVNKYPPGNLFTEYVDNTTARWPLGTALVFRLPSEATVCGYDLVSGWYESTKEEPFKWTVTDWTLEGSPDGRAWRTLDAKSGYLTCRTKKNYWLSDARPYDEASTGFPIDSEDGRCVKGRTLGTVAVATGATLEVRGEPAATGLSVGVDWAGTFRGVDFAPTGTLTVKVPIDAGRAFTIPCSFEDCAGTENLKNWTLSFDGDPGATWALARADASGLLFAKQGFILIVK